MKSLVLDLVIIFLKSNADYEIWRLASHRLHTPDVEQQIREIEIAYVIFRQG